MSSRCFTVTSSPRLFATRRLQTPPAYLRDRLSFETERQSERNMEEDSGERDEGEQLDMGSPGTTSIRQKPMAHFG